MRHNLAHYDSSDGPCTKSVSCDIIPHNLTSRSDIYLSIIRCCLSSMCKFTLHNKRVIQLNSLQPYLTRAHEVYAVLILSRSQAIKLLPWLPGLKS